MLKGFLFQRAPVARQPSEEGFTLTVSGRDHPVALKRSARARRFTLRVKANSGEIVVTAPTWAKLRDVQAFAARHTQWIAGRLARLETRTPFVPGASVPFRGVPHRIVHRPMERGVVWAASAGDGTRELRVSGHLDHVGRRLVDFFKAEARRDLLEAVAAYTNKLGKPVKRVTIRDQTSRWGSCSSTGALSFSWRLVLAPPFILDYLAAHEVAHLAEMNHGPRFWRTLRALCPETDRAKAWMRANGAKLHSYGPTAGAPPDPDSI